jgi:hypothetical protein
MGARHRRKGVRGEREAVAWLDKAGVYAQRVPLSGAAQGYEGDLVVVLPPRWGAREVKLEVKRRRALPRWLRPPDWAWGVMLREDRGEWLLLLRARDFVDLLWD